MDKENFKDEIKRLLLEAKEKGKEYLEISAGKVHRNVGGYPGKNHRIPTCCEAMYELKTEKDQIIQSPPKGKGATLKIRYYL
ncbi:MAG: hypothetical protein RR324_00895 [Cellulosilyticaceae bacterium]